MAFLPYAGKNSIVEALLGVQFAQPIAVQIGANFEQLEAEFKPELPKFEQMQQVSVTIGSTPMNLPQLPNPMAPVSIAGFSASAIRPDGNPARVFRGFGNTISSHFLEYDRWNGVRDQGLQYLDRCLRILRLPSTENAITGIQMTFIDRFTFDGVPEDARLDALVKPTTRYLPHNLLSLSGVWQFTSIWPMDGASGRTDHNLNVQGLVEKNAAVMLVHNQGRWLADGGLKSIDQVSKDGALSKQFDELHHANAAMLRNVLSDATLKQIGLS